MITLSDQQGTAVRAIAAWHRSPESQVFKVHGPAGSGKTEIVRHAVDECGAERVLYGTLTGKAALVLRRRGVPCQTVHSMIYRWVEDEDTGRPVFRLNDESALRDADLLVLDECSMLSGDVAADLLSFGVPTLVLGDPYQLPPVEGAGAFDGEPDVMLTEVHRQALGSAVLRLATDVREGKLPSIMKEDGVEVTARTPDAAELLCHDQVICGTHVTRRRINNYVRRESGLTKPLPVAGEKVICLRNERDSGLVNGCFLDLSDAVDFPDAGSFLARIRTEDGTTIGPRHVWAGPFLDHLHFDSDRPRPGKRLVQADFGYAITCHKSQGSGWPGVCVVDDGWGRTAEDRRRWLYTAVTRAEDRLLLVRR